MTASIYVGIAAQRALLQRLDTVAANVANQATPGYRAEDIAFQSLVSAQAAPTTSFTMRGETHLSTRAGGVSPTGNPLDVAITGDAWFQVATSAGRAVTRDGRFQMAAGGELRTVAGDAVLDAGGAPIALDPGAGPVTIARDGRILQSGRQTGAIGLFAVPADARLSRGPNGSVVSDRPVAAQLDFDRVAVVQGFIEGSNVDPMLEMARLIALQRTFDAVSATVAESEAAQTEGIRSLGSG